MKSVFSKIAIPVAGLLLLAACKDHRMDKMIDDSVYLVNTGVNEQKIFTGEGFSYAVTAIKAGTGRQSGTVGLTVNESLLPEYGSEYTLLPDNYYSLGQNQINFGKADYQLAFDVTFDAAGIRALKASTGLTYAIPFELTTAEASLKPAPAPGQSVSIVVPLVLDPWIGFKAPGLQGIASSINSGSPSETKFNLFVSTNYHNQWDLSYDIVVDAAALEAYNQANKTTYKLLPAEAYRLDTEALSVPKLQNENSFTYYLLKDKAAAGTYMLPLRISSVSKHGIDPDRSLMLIPVTIE